MRRNASARDCSDPIAITASSNRNNCFAPANSKRLGTTGGYDPPPLASRRDDSHDASESTSLAVIRVFLLDDHEVVRRGVRELLETADDLEVVGEAGTAAEAVQRAPATSPDVAVLDVRLPDGSGIEVCRDLRSLLPELRCLMLTSFNDDEALFDAVMAGASGYVLKEVRGAELIDSVRSVAAGRSLLDPLATARVLERIRNPPQDALTATLSPQETAILGHLADGLTNRADRRCDVPRREDGEELRLQPARQARDDAPDAGRGVRRPAGRTAHPPTRHLTPLGAGHKVTSTVVCVL